MKILCPLIVLVALTYIECLADSDYVIYDLKKAGQLFIKFRHDFGKHYSTPQETQMRFEIFKQNLRHINEINSKHGSWSAGINQFADMTADEVRKCCMGFKPPKKLNKKRIILPRTKMVILDSSLEDSDSE